VLWHLTPEQVAAGESSPTSIPLGPGIPYIAGCDNVHGVVALSDTRRRPRLGRDATARTVGP
jgi:hypothetical protein